MTYAEEKLTVAIFHCLATGEGDARDRLSKSFQHFLFALREEHFNSDHWERFKKIKVRLTKKGPFKICGKIILGSFENGKKGMKNKTARKMIEELICIYQELTN